MKTFQYQIIKYVHDHFTGEFLNVGIIMYSPENLFLKCRVTNKYKRITNLFPAVNGRWVIRVLRNIQNEVNRTSGTLHEIFQPSEHLEMVTGKIFPKDSSAIQLTDVKTGLDVDLDAALNDLFADLVEKYNQEPSPEGTLSDDDVWKLKYKEYFDRFSISNKLTTHEVTTRNDSFVFEKAWKNEIWHCYEPVSFMLKNKESIKDKVYKWAGRLQGLTQSSEKIHITLLTSVNPKYSMTEFINSYLKIDNEQLNVDIVTENEAESVVKQLNELMTKHDKQN